MTISSSYNLTNTYILNISLLFGLQPGSNVSFDISSFLKRQPLSYKVTMASGDTGNFGSAPYVTETSSFLQGQHIISSTQGSNFLYLQTNNSIIQLFTNQTLYNTTFINVPQIRFQNQLCLKIANMSQEYENQMYTVSICENTQNGQYFIIIMNITTTPSVVRVISTPLAQLNQMIIQGYYLLILENDPIKLHWSG
jgi:hypothetical protein